MKYFIREKKNDLYTGTRKQRKWEKVKNNMYQYIIFKLLKVGEVYFAKKTE